jgi:hypothetical protein
VAKCGAVFVALCCLEIRAGRIELLPFGIDIMATNVTPSLCAEAISRSASARLRLAACAATLRQRGQRLERRPRPAENG